MADTKKNEETETEAAPKPKTTAKAKAKPKVKPKAETASRANTADVAPYLSKNNKIKPSQTQAPKQNSFTSLLLIAVIAILVVITTYKLTCKSTN